MGIDNHKGLQGADGKHQNFDDYTKLLQYRVVNCHAVYNCTCQ
jgi:hypothetical protein